MRPISTCRRTTRSAIYYSYFTVPETMFPVPDRNDQLETKDVVLGVQLNGSSKAYPSALLREHRIVNDVVGGEDILVLGSETGSQGARAYYRNGRSFQLLPGDGGSSSGIPTVISTPDGERWRVTEEFLVNTGDESDKLARIPTHMSFWFGWFQFHPDTELYTGP